MPTLEDLLEKTSRTFALSIPVLPEPTRREVMISYLLFRIADTFEDASHWPPEKRITSLHDFNELLRKPSPNKARSLSKGWVAASISPHPGYTELMTEVPFVLDAFWKLEPEAIEQIKTHVIRSAEGMASIVAKTKGGRLVLSSVHDLQAYCYIVAGIVGELLTDLFLLDAPQLARERAALEADTRAFGEGLQLVNILKDSSADAIDGRTYLPADVSRAEILALARTDLDGAGRYVGALDRGHAPRGFIAFTALSLMLARAALDRLESAGAGAKVSREDVFKIFSRLEGALERGETVKPLLS
jgi:farnesyl-diphosphate farnesyltransferase